MPTILTNSFRGSIARSILTDIQYGRSRYYHFLGGTASWGVGDTPPTTIPDTQDSLTQLRNEIIVAKRVDPMDVSLVVERVDWTAGVVYDMWDSSVDMSTKTFYAMTPEFRVYKCLNNNQGAASTIKPTFDSSLAQTLADGYTWKYMYTVPEIKRNRFADLNHIPVQQAVTDRFYNNGSISNAYVLTPGSGYTNQSLTQLVIAGGTGAIAVPQVSALDGSIIGVTVVNGGTGYTTPTFTITGSGHGIYGNATATFRAVVEGGIIKRIAVLDPGTGYTFEPNASVTVHGDGTGAIINPIIYGGQVVDLAIQNFGKGYTYCTLTINGTSTTQATAAVVLQESDFYSDQSVIEQTAINGAIHAIVVTGQGDSYTTATVTVEGDGTGCTATPTLVDGRITKITVDNVGSGYTYANIVIAGNNLEINPSATNATARAIYSPIGGHGKNAPDELFARKVGIFSNLRSVVDTAIQQEYRQYGLVSGLRDLYTGEEISNKNIITTHLTAKFVSATGLVLDEILVSGNGEFRVLAVNGTSVTLLPLTSPTSNPIGTLYAKTEHARNYNCIAVLDNPKFNKYSGKIVYFSDDAPFTYSADQSIVIKTFIRF